jgi:uncharacterized protein (UPF0332 family)
MKEVPPYKQALIEYRMERAHQTLNAAKLLDEQSVDSASIVNRAYYAIFYAALAMLATVGEESLLALIRHLFFVIIKPHNTSYKSPQNCKHKHEYKTWFLRNNTIPYAQNYAGNQACPSTY